METAKRFSLSDGKEETRALAEAGGLGAETTPNFFPVGKTVRLCVTKAAVPARSDSDPAFMTASLTCTLGIDRETWSSRRILMRQKRDSKTEAVLAHLWSLSVRYKKVTRRRSGGTIPLGAAAPKLSSPRPEARNSSPRHRGAETIPLGAEASKLPRGARGKTGKNPGNCRGRAISLESTKKL